MWGGTGVHIWGGGVNRSSYVGGGKMIKNDIDKYLDKTQEFLYDYL